MNSSTAPEAPPPGRRALRSKRSHLRNGTFVLPATGERVRRQITLRNRPDFDGALDQDAHLPRHGASAASSRRRTYLPAGSFGMAVDDTIAALEDAWEYLKTPTAKAILKCSFAYLLGSMATFLPFLANFLGHQDGKHVVATITVYFHPARSAGSMVEATMLGIVAFLYATFVSILSMGVSAFFETQLHQIFVGYALVLIVFCGGGLGFVGWFKLKYNAPLVNVACSLASLAIITVLTKENAVHAGVFSDDKIIQVMKMVILGISFTSLVSLLVWPRRARTELRETMIKTTDSFGDMLTMITSGFLSGAETELRSTSFNTAANRYKQGLSQLTNNLKEARFEYHVLGKETEYKIVNNLVNCMQRIAQSIGGLRSAATTQFTLLKEANGSGTPIKSRRRPGSFIPSHSIASILNARQDSFATLTAIEEASEEGSGVDDRQEQEDSSPHTLQRYGTERSVESTTMSPRTPPEIFSRFILILGPPMKSLAYTLSQILQELPFGGGPDYAIAINENFKTSLTDALNLYSSARTGALRELYRFKELDSDRHESIEADFEEVAASCGHFSFSLQDFASEMQAYLAILEELKEVTENPSNRSWNWLFFWRRSKSAIRSGANVDPEQEALLHQSTQVTVQKDLAEVVFDGRKSKSWQTALHKRDVKITLYSKILRFLRFLERDDIRFALKVGFGAALYALFAFIPTTRPFYQRWRGEWGLLSYMLVCSMTIGASNTTGWARFIGTVIGGVIAVIVWILCQGNAFALAFCGWLVSLPCFYIIIAKGKGPFGRFIMLTYNLSCLYAYSLSIKEGEDDEDEGGANPKVTEIVVHRVVAVLAGVLWGLIITRLIWPISARQKFKDGLSLLWLRMGLIWQRDPLSTLMEGETQNVYVDIRQGFALQEYVSRLDVLRAAATSELDLRGPFPSKEYERIMESTNKILDAFHAMNVVIQKNPHATDGELALLRSTIDERAQLCARISHLFQVLASSMKLEYPLTDALPNTTNARDKLLTKVFQYRKLVANATEDDGIIAPTDEDYEILYAYTLVIGQLAEEIRKVERAIEDLFGVMDEELFKLL